MELTNIIINCLGVMLLIVSFSYVIEKIYQKAK